MNKQGPNGIAYCDYTWSPVTGCLHECDYCFAKVIANRFQPHELELMDIDACQWIHPASAKNLSCRVCHEPVVLTDFKGAKLRVTPYPAGFRPTFHRYRLDEPVKVKKPSRILVSDMGDLFGEWVPREWINAVLETVQKCPQHTFLFLTKNPARYQEFLWPANAWLGTSVENQHAADERIPLLLRVPAVVKFISAEPLLGPIDLHVQGVDTTCRCDGCLDLAKDCPDMWQAQRIDWVIVGGQSGANARPMHPDWARSLRDQCQAAGVAFFFKHWGIWAEHTARFGGGLFLKPNGQLGCQGDHWDGKAVAVCKVGRKKAGRLLDWRTWDEIPIR